MTRTLAALIPSQIPRTDLYPDYQDGPSLGIPMYALRDTDLSAIAGLIIPNSADQRELLRCSAQLEAYLCQGGRVLFNGHVVYPWLSVLRPFEPTPEPGLAGLQVRTLGRHPIFAGVQAEELTLRQGVAGFYGRGFNPPPAGAQVLNELGTASRCPIDWLYTWPAPEAGASGELLVHAGNDLLSFGNRPSTQGLRQAVYRWAAAGHAETVHAG